MLGKRFFWPNGEYKHITNLAVLFYSIAFTTIINVLTTNLTVGFYADVKDGFTWKIFIVLKVGGGQGK